jgi:DNA invertase Pin-like site-specific DNA recombinase
MTALGYARVSTSGQTLDAQVAELVAAGCTEIFQEKVSGAVAARDELARLLSVLGRGDELVVTRLDRLARSTRDLLNIIAVVTEKGAQFRSLRDAWADTGTALGRLMLTVLGGIAEFERELIRSRTAEGRIRARANGVTFGRPPKLSSQQKMEALRRRLAGEGPTIIAKDYNVSSFTIMRLGGKVSLGAF